MFCLLYSPKSLSNLAIIRCVGLGLHYNYFTTRDIGPIINNNLIINIIYLFIFLIFIKHLYPGYPTRLEAVTNVGSCTTYLITQTIDLQHIYTNIYTQLFIIYIHELSHDLVTNR